MTGDDVKILQIYLNNHGYTVAQTGIGLPLQIGSLGHETTYFGMKTKIAVMTFQMANNLTPDGVVGPITREKMK